MSGFLFLRPSGRPALVALAGTLAACLAVVLAVGATSFALTGYGGGKELAIALGLLSGSILLYLFRRVVQDRQPLRLRDSAPLPESS